MRHLSPRRRRHWALAGATLLLALGSVVLLRTPESAAALPATPTPPDQVLPSVTPTTSSAAGSSRVTLSGPRVEGLFAFTEGAALAGGDRDIYAELRLTGDQLGAVASRPPVALAVVLDHSGSMGGDKIVQAREAVVSLLQRMRDQDYLAVVIYDHEAQLLQPLASVASLRAELPARLRSVDARGGTNIPIGLDAGEAALASAPPDAVRRLVLLSDGQDGSGLSLEEISRSVAARAEARTTTSSVGIGLDYDERFMTGLADAGRGNYAFLATASALDPFLVRELEQASATVAEQVVAEFDLPPGLTLRSAHGAIVATDGQTLRVPLGTLFAGERRKVVFELSARMGSVGSSLSVPARLRWRTVEDHREHAAGGGAAAVLAVATQAEIDATRDIDMHADAVGTAIDAQQIAAADAFRSGDRHRARRLTRAHIGALQQAQAVAPSPRLAARIQALEADDDAYESHEAGSAEAESYGRARGASRHDLAGAF